MEGDIRLTRQEFAILIATQLSDSAQTTFQLAQHAEARTSQAQRTIDELVQKSILEPIENYDDSIVYAYQANNFAQAVYELIYQEKRASLQHPMDTLDIAHGKRCLCRHLLRSPREKAEGAYIECRLKSQTEERKNHGSTPLY